MYTCFRANIYYPFCCFNDIRIMFHNKNTVALFS